MTKINHGQGFRDGRFDGKIVVVIGGNSGIGLESAQHFAREGATVIISGRNPETLKDAVLSLGESGSGAVADISDAEATSTFMKNVISVHGRIDVLFVNAGVGWFSDVWTITPEKFNLVIDTNLKGAFFAAQMALPAMKAGGSILFTSSAGSKIAVSGNVAYAASKAGLRAAARIMAHELARDGIRVNVISPGGIDTPIMHRDQGITPAQMAEIGSSFMSAVPLGRIGTTTEVAAAVLFLCSDEASYITGIDLFIDGGIATP